jgi:hypothetical protein
VTADNQPLHMTAAGLAVILASTCTCRRRQVSVGVTASHPRFRLPHPDDRTMAKHLISFLARAMDVSAEDMAAVGEVARAVIREAKRAGVYVFGGGINEDVAPLLVTADGAVISETYPQTTEFSGDFCVLELLSREAAFHGAARIATACRRKQELREFGCDPES